MKILFELKLLLLISFSLVWVASVNSQTFSFEMTDTSMSILEHTETANTVIAELKGNKNNSSGQISLIGVAPRIELNNLQIAHLGGNELGLDGDIVPYASVTFDLGNNVSDEHWDQVVAEAFITYVPPAARIVSTKKISSALSQILQIDPVEYTTKNKRRSSGFLIPQLKKHLPEVLSSEDIDFDTKNQKEIITETNTGINYNAFIPILIKALQEQQTQIQELQTQIVDLINN